MLFKSSIYNHNFYPIQIIDIKNIIRDKDKIHISPNFYIDDVSQKKLFLKPFQKQSFLTNVLPNENVDLIDTVIYLDTTLATDSYDYGTFINITGQPVYIKKKHIDVFIDSEGLSSFFIDEKTYNNLTFEDFELEISLKSQPQIQKLLLQNQKINNNIKIIDFDLYTNGAYGTLMKEPSLSDDCDTNPPFMRGPLVMTHNEINDFMLNFNQNIKYHVRYDAHKDDVILHISIDSVTFKQILKKLSDTYKTIFQDIVENESYNQQLLPIIQQPMGMTVIFNITPNISHPFLLNIKYINGLLIFCNQDFIDDNQNNEYEHLDYIRNVNFNKPQPSTLLPSKSPIIINSYENYYYSDIIKLVPYIAKKPGFDEDNTTNSYTINNIQLETPNSNIIIHTDETIPITKCVPKRLENKKLTSTDLILDVTNISNDVSNNIIINYTIDNETTNIKIPIKIQPKELEANITIDSDVVSNNSLYINGVRTISANGTNKQIIPKELAKINHYKELHTLTNELFENDTFDVYIQNDGNLDCTITNIEFINTDKFKKEYPSDYNKLSSKYILYHLYYNKKYDFSQFVNIKLNNIINNGLHNTNKLNPIILTFETKRLKATPTNLHEGIQCIIKITYNNNKTAFVPINFYNIKPIIKTILHDDLNLMLPNSQTTKFFDISYDIQNIPIYAPPQLKQFPIILKSLQILGDINNDEFLIEKNQFPVTITENTTFNVDFKPKHNNKLYNINLRLFTSSSTIPFFDIPFTFLASKIVAEDYITFDNNDFYVLNNKYFLSTLKLSPKTRKIKIKNNNNSIDFIIKSISFYSQKDKFGVDYVKAKLTKDVKLPYNLSHNSSLPLNIEFTSTDVGHFILFIILDTNYGQVQLPISVFCNTKLKDVFILMKNRRGVEFTAPLQGIDKEYIKLINFGDEPSLIEMTKLSYDKDEFYIKNKTRIAPKSTNYIETLFIPSSSGQKLSYVDIKIKDMLETFRLTQNDTTQVFKIQNAHIIADMLGVALSQNAVPQFEKSVIDFGFLPKNNKHLLSRYDNVKIKNLGLNPFIITKIIKTDDDSPFMLPFFNNNLPMLVKKEITFPVMINNLKLNDNKNKYMDMFKFEIQDLKTKQIFYYELIVKLELSEDNREYFSFNSEFINFGYCEINHFKEDTLTIKNFSTDKCNIHITMNGAPEFQTPNNFNITLQPSQTFNIPIFFFPHGLNTFNGTLQLNFNNGNYIKNVGLVGIGVDFKSPFIYTENKMLKYYEEILEYFI